VRRALKVRTIMNMLGPCVNPAEPKVQLLGVAEPKLLEPVARTLAALGVASALVVHGSGLDEIALHAETQAVRVTDGELERITIAPEDAGLARAPVTALKGGDPEENAERFKALLSGYALRAETDTVALNTGALLLTAGISRSLKEGVDLAAQAIASGAAYGRLRAFVDATHG
jgi:anthranilate phosphoribosyltransferase